MEFEGEYLNGERNGKGKEYGEDNQIIFEGEYMDGEKWNGKADESYYDGNLEYKEYKGEYRNGFKWEGKGYDEEGNIVYELINGNGKVEEIKKKFHHELIFEGEYLNGKRNWKGKEYYYIGQDIPVLIFEGEYLNGERWNGKGEEIGEDSETLFEGEYINGKKNGKGKEYNEEGIVTYVGEYLDDKKITKINCFDD